MRTTPFRAVLDEVLAAVGLAYDSTLSTQLIVAVNAINRRVQEAWHWARWPEWTLTEERGFADPWNDGIAYASGDVVWDATTEAYYEAQATVPAGTVLSNTTYWAEDTTPTTELVEWEQYGANEIGRVWAITDKDPRINETVTNYGWAEGPSGIYVPEASGETVWLTFQEPPPIFSPKVWSADVVYNLEDVVFYPSTETTGIFPQDGECYICQKDDEGTYFWQLVQFPAALRAYVTLAAGGDMMRYYGNRQAAAALIAEAREYLQEEVSKLGMLNSGGSLEVVIPT